MSSWTITCAISTCLSINTCRFGCSCPPVRYLFHLVLWTCQQIAILFGQLTWMDGLRLRYSTAQPFCRMENGNSVLYVFFAIPGIKPEFSFASNALDSTRVHGGTKSETSNQVLISDIEPSSRIVFERTLPAGKRVQVVVLTRKQAESATRISMRDGDHLVLYPQEVFSDGHSITLRALAQPDFNFLAWPSLPFTQGSSLRVQTQADDGIFKAYRASDISRAVVASWTPVKSMRSKPASISDPNTVPTEEEIGAAPPMAGQSTQKRLCRRERSFPECVVSRGHCAPHCDGHLLTDEFYTGLPWSIGLNRFRKQVESRSLNLSIVPWRDRSKVVLDDSVNKVEADSARLSKVTIVPEYELTVR